MIFRSLLEYCRVKAIADALSPTEDSIWRDACRTYSKTFNTPLHEVLRMDMEHVFLNNFEEQLDNMNLDDNVENLLEQVYIIENPDYHQEQEDELQDFIRKVEEQEKKSISKKSLLKKEVEIPKDMPTGGSVDFSNLKDEEG